MAVEENKPRRRASTTVVSLEEGPVDTTTTIPKSMVITQHKSIQHQKQWSQFSILAVVVSLIFFFGLYTSWGQWRDSRSHASDFLTATSDNTVEEPSLGIALHPEEHRSRHPRRITLHWTITSDIRAPDGVKKRVYLINGQFPGPTIEARSGDTLMVQVVNALLSSPPSSSSAPPPHYSPYYDTGTASPAPSSHGEGIAIHWHGLHMRSFNAMDGAVGFTQCAIPPGKNFTYEFQIGEEQHGTFWYHAHSQVQRGDGLWGGLVVHRPLGEDEEMDDRGVGEMEMYGYRREVLLMVGDWFHRSAEEMLGWYTSVGGFGNEPVPDSLLVNGIGAFNCSMAVPARPVECTQVLTKNILGIFGKDLVPTRLRVVNTGSIAGITIGVSHAKLTPLQVDGGCEIAGLASDFVGILYPGERVDLLIDWDSQVYKTGSELEIIMDPENFNYPNPCLTPNQTFPILPHAAHLSTQTDIPPLSIPAPAATRYRPPSPKSVHFDLQTASSSANHESLISTESSHTILLYIKTEKLAIHGNHPKSFINRTSWSPQSPPLLTLPRSAWDTNQFVPQIPLSPSPAPIWADIILNNLDEGSHPFHLHGFSFYILATYRSTHGWGSWNPYSNAPSNVAVAPELNVRNPLLKDTVSVPRRGYAVVRFRADSEGVWMLHCHVLVHLGSGMAMGVQVGGEDRGGVMDDGAGKLCG